MEEFVEIAVYGKGRTQGAAGRSVRLQSVREEAAAGTDTDRIQ